MSRLLAGTEWKVTAGSESKKALRYSNPRWLPTISMGILSPAWHMLGRINTSITKTTRH